MHWWNFGHWSWERRHGKDELHEMRGRGQHSRHGMTVYTMTSIKGKILLIIHHIVTTKGSDFLDKTRVLVRLPTSLIRGGLAWFRVSYYELPDQSYCRNTMDGMKHGARHEKLQVSSCPSGSFNTSSESLSALHLESGHDRCCRFFCNTWKDCAQCGNRHQFHYPTRMVICR